jgi:hypothetical protein
MREQDEAIRMKNGAEGREDVYRPPNAREEM